MRMQCQFEVGQRVVCITPDWLPFTFLDVVLRWWRGNPLPKLNGIYVVSAITTARGFVWVKLVDHGSLFDPFCFRPLVERETDIGVFTRILADVNAGKIKPVVVPA